MLLIKVSLFCILQWKKKDFVDFWHRKMTLKVWIVLFWPSILKRWKGENYFYGHFHSALVLLMGTLAYLPLNSTACRKKNFGHTIEHLSSSIGLLPNQCWRWGRMSPFWIFCPFFLSPWCRVYYYDSKILGPCVYFAENSHNFFNVS